jgi:hypothetical protein
MQPTATAGEELYECIVSRNSVTHVSVKAAFLSGRVARKIRSTIEHSSASVSDVSVHWALIRDKKA